MLYLAQLVLAQFAEAQAAATPPPSALPSTGNTTADTIMYVVTALAGLHSVDKVAFWWQKVRAFKTNGGPGDGMLSILKKVVNGVEDQAHVLKELTEALKRVENEVREMRVEIARGGKGSTGL